MNSLENIQHQSQENQEEQNVGNLQREMSKYTKRSKEQYNDQNLKECLIKRAEAEEWIFDKYKIEMNDFELNKFMMISEPSKKIQRLEIDCSSYEKIGKGLLYLSEGLKKLDSLQHMSLDLTYCTKIKDSTMIDLSQGLKRLVCLKGITLKFELCFHLSEIGICSLMNGIKRIPSLLQFSLSLISCSKITKKVVPILSKALSRMISLQDFDFTLQQVRLEEKELQMLKESLIKLIHLRRLGLLIQTSFEILEKGFLILNEAFKRHPKLEFLRLHFPSTYMGPKGLNKLGELLEALTCLEEIDLKFQTGDGIDDDEFEKFNKRFQKLTGLKRLKMDFQQGWSQITDQGWPLLFQAIKQFIALEYIYLDLTLLSKFDDSSMKYLGRALKCLPCLKTTHLIFRAEERRISDYGLKMLSGFFGEIAMLQHLNLTFYSCSGISNKGLLSLIASFKYLSKLKSLLLNFEYSKKITDEGLTDLGEGFEALASLEKLHLNFSRSENVTGVGLSNMSKSFQRIKCLKNLKLEFYWMRKVDDTMLLNLKEGLQGLHLQNLWLDFGSYIKI